MTTCLPDLPPPASFMDGCRVRCFDPPPPVIARLGRYAALLLRARARVNLTSIHAPDEIWTRHLLESLNLLPLLPEGIRVLDLGSGGGVPGIPLAIARPDLRMTLLEATGKKASFLRRACADLDLAGTVVLEGRAETWGRDPAHRDTYDAVLVRAVGALPELIELSLPFLRTGGRLLAVKSERVHEEAAAAEAALAALGGRLESIARTGPVPEGVLVACVRKLRDTPPAFPRRPGIPRKRPL